ncbi:hypothetical protein NMG60_11024162 [Bertholletia excelsa]
MRILCLKYLLSFLIHLFLTVRFAPYLAVISNCFEPPAKRKKCLGVHLLGGRIYNSENEKTCHQVTGWKGLLTQTEKANAGRC